MKDRIEALAERLMAEGHCDNEADARLAAIRIIWAASHIEKSARRDDEPAEWPGPQHRP